MATLRKNKKWLEINRKKVGGERVFFCFVSFLRKKDDVGSNGNDAAGKIRETLERRERKRERERKKKIER